MSFAKTVEISAESSDSFEHAVKQGIERATTTLKNVRSVWVKDQEALVENNAVSKYRVFLKVTFVMD